MRPIAFTVLAFQVVQIGVVKRRYGVQRKPAQRRACHGQGEASVCLRLFFWFSIVKIRDQHITITASAINKTTKMRLVFDDGALPQFDLRQAARQNRARNR